MMTQKKLNGLAAVLGGLALLSAANAKEPAEPKTRKAAEHGAPPASALKTDKDKVSYGVGVDIGKNFKRLGLDIDLDVVTKGLKDAYSGSTLKLSEEELRTLLNAYQSELMQKQAATMKAAGEANQKAGEAFLAENAKKEGVVTLPSGLQYKILKAGTGKIPTDADTVECQYRGTLINGTEFDSSYRTGKPAFFNLGGGVIPGWKEALKLMPVGSKWQLFIPPPLAYGPRGAGRDIGPNSTLVFEVELVGIKPPEAKPVEAKPAESKPAAP